MSSCGRIAVAVGMFGAGLLGGVEPQQVVEFVAAVSGFLEQVRADQLIEQLARCGGVGAGGGYCCRQADVRAGMETETPEQAGRLGRQRPVGPGDRCAYSGARVALHGKGVQAIRFVGEITGQVGERDARPAGDAVGDDRQRQRQVSAPAGQRGGGGGVSVNPVRAANAGQEGQ